MLVLDASGAALSVAISARRARHLEQVTEPKSVALAAPVTRRLFKWNSERFRYLTYTWRLTAGGTLCWADARKWKLNDPARIITSVLIAVFAARHVAPFSSRP